MLSNSTIQSAWVATLKANVNITALVPAVEIREDSYKGTQFTYPNIRVKLGKLVPQNQSNNCQIFRSEVSILVFTEQKSSKQADDIAGVIASEYWGKAFSKSGVRFSGITLDALMPAMVPDFDPNSWLASVEFTAGVGNG